MRLAYENVYQEKIFGSLIARLFAGSFSMDTLPKQDFRLGSKEGSLVRLTKSWLGNKRIEGTLESKFSTFNSTSMSSYLVKALMSEWDAKVKKPVSIGKCREIAYSELVKKLKDRRCSLRLRNPYLAAHGGTPIGNYTAEERSTIFRVPLFPQKYSRPKNSYVRAAVKKVERIIQRGLNWDTIHYSCYSESDKLLDNYIRNRRQKNTD